MLYPTLNEVTELLNEYKMTPVFCEVLSDTCTPIHIYNALESKEENCFILESVDNSQQWGRYSFIGINPKAEIKVKNGTITHTQGTSTATLYMENPISYLSHIMEEYRSPNFPNKPKLTGGLIGYFAYDTVRYMEQTVSSSPEDDLDMPDCHLFLYDEIIAFDHLSNKVVIILNISQKGDISAQYEARQKRADEIAEMIRSYIPTPKQRGEKKDITVTSNVTEAEFTDMVVKAKEHIVNGDIFQIVLSQRFEVENPPEPFDVYRMLRAANPSPYLYYFKHKEYQIAGASPEMLVNVTKGIVSTKPIAGTIGRSILEEEDKKLEQQLLNDPKERAEHTMLVDLGRNDVGKVSKFGTVEVTGFMHVERYSKVMHLVSDVKGLLRDDKNCIRCTTGSSAGRYVVRRPKSSRHAAYRPAWKTNDVDYTEVPSVIWDLTETSTPALPSAPYYLKTRKLMFKQAPELLPTLSPKKEKHEETQKKALAVINAIKDASQI